MPVCLGEWLLPKRDFDKLLLEAVDEGMSSLGESSRLAIYFHLEKSFDIKKHEIPRKIEAFADAIETIFGKGANFLEILIMRRLYEKIGGIFDLQESVDFAFARYVTAAKRGLLEKNKAKNMAEEIVRCDEMGIEA